jgi:hypothetical protein
MQLLTVISESSEIPLPYVLTPAGSLRRIIASNRGNPPSVSHSGSGTGFPVTTVDESNVALPVTSPV